MANVETIGDDRPSAAGAILLTRRNSAGFGESAMGKQSLERPMRRRGLIATALMTLTASRARAAPAPVVLELFTSQGCSSCPPADALLGELSRQPQVIALAWHVDYWDGLGWRDPYARRAWTDRQKNYARSLSAEVYTPALVVNGAAMVVGSDKVSVRQAIDRAVPASVNIRLRRTGSGLEAEIDPLSSPVTGLLVSYDPEQSTEVGAGENQGRRLTEYRVVREIMTLDSVAPDIMLPSVPAERGAVLLLQDAAWRVIGAADLPPGTGT